MNSLKILGENCALHCVNILLTVVRLNTKLHTVLLKKAKHGDLSNRLQASFQRPACNVQYYNAHQTS